MAVSLLAPAAALSACAPQAEEFALRDALQAAQRTADAALRDNIDTPRALEAVQDLVKAANLYRAERDRGADGTPACPGQPPLTGAAMTRFMPCSCSRSAAACHASSLAASCVTVLAGLPAQRLLLADAAGFVARILFVMGVASSPHVLGFGDEPELSAGFAACMDALADCREALRKLPGPQAADTDVSLHLDRCGRVSLLYACSQETGKPERASVRSLAQRLQGHTADECTGILTAAASFTRTIADLQRKGPVPRKELLALCDRSASTHHCTGCDAAVAARACICSTICKHSAPSCVQIARRAAASPWRASHRPHRPGLRLGP